MPYIFRPSQAVFHSADATLRSTQTWDQSATKRLQETTFSQSKGSDTDHQNCRLRVEGIKCLPSRILWCSHTSSTVLQPVLSVRGGNIWSSMPLPVRENAPHVTHSRLKLKTGWIPTSLVYAAALRVFWCTLRVVLHVFFCLHVFLFCFLLFCAAWTPAHEPKSIQMFLVHFYRLTVYCLGELMLCREWV